MTTLWQDIRYGVRVLAKNPGFTAVAVLTLALGIGANTAIFSLINALLLKSLPGVKDPQRLALVTVNGWPNLSYPLYEHLRDNSQSFSGLFAGAGISKRTLRVVGSGAVEEVPAWNQAVSGNFFSVLGARAILGRTLTPDDDRAGAPQPVAVLSYDFWERRFGRDPAVLGKTVMLGEVPLTIVGVAAREFLGFVVGSRPDLWWPIQMVPQVQAWDDALTEGGSQWLQIAGCRKPDVVEAQAQDEVGVVFQQMLLAQPGKWPLSETDRQKSLTRIELRPAGMGFTWLHREFNRMLFVLMAIVGLLLLVACTNLAGLLLARGAARQREFSVRAALGAGRVALIRQLVTESLLLALAGGVLGLLLAQWGVRLLANYLPEQGDAVQLQLTPDLRILAFTFLVSLGTGLLFGLLPAWRSSRLDVRTALKDQAGNLMGRLSGQSWNKALMVAQIALSCCLLIGAGLFVRTFQKLRTVDVGFDRENLMVFGLTLGKGYENSSRRGSLYEDVVQRVQNLPSVRSVSMSSIQSLGGGEIGVGLDKVAVAGPDATADEGLDVRGTAVGLGYFQTMHIPLLLGRDFSPQDELMAQTDPAGQVPRPVILDQTSARRLFGEENPVGKLLRTRRSSRAQLEVIGVVGDVIHKGLRGGPRISVYCLVTYRSGLLEFFHIRTSGSPLAAATAIRQVVRELDPQVEVSGLHTTDDLVNDQLRRERMLSQLSGFFSLTALALVCLGLYGILSYNVARRTREIGVRMALGAQKYDVLSGVIRQGMTLTLVGCGLGVLLAVALTRIISSLLYGVTPTDPLTFALTVLLLGAVAFVSCWLPARRAARIDPMVALRCE
jgi:predicted permease